MGSYKHFVTNQAEFDIMARDVHESEKGSHHLICFHGHGNAETDDFIVTIDRKANPRCIFIKSDNSPLHDLNQIIKTAFENDKYIYIIAVSCFWNEKYKKGLTVPTISLAPDVSSSIPYPFENLRGRINSLPDKFDKEFMVNLFQNMKKNLNVMMNCWAHIEDDTGKERKDGGYILKYNDESIKDDDSWDSRFDEDKRHFERRRAHSRGSTAIYMR